MPHSTQLPKVDLHTFRVDARKVINENVFPRYEDVLFDIQEQCQRIEAMADLIDAHLSRRPDPAAEAIVATCREATKRTCGKGLRSADDLRRHLATAVLELADLFETLP